MKTELEAKDLRIGNLVQDYNERIVEVSAEILGHFNQLSMDQNTALISIPLTEEWLIKFGYNEVDDFYAKGYGVNGVSIIKWENYYNAFAYQLGKGYNKIVKEVHQLQNLYSSLTGKELTINETIKA